MVNWKDFEVGKRVVCVDDEWDNGVVENEIMPVKGVIYTIRAVELCGEGKNLCIQLVEIVNAPMQYSDEFGEVSFAARRFRPIDETRIDQFRAMLTNLPKLSVLEYQG